jgi:hypothetical protein
LENALSFHIGFSCSMENLVGRKQYENTARAPPADDPEAAAFATALFMEWLDADKTVG